MGLITPKIMIDMSPGGDGPGYINPSGKKGNPGPFKPYGGTSCSSPRPIEMGLITPKIDTSPGGDGPGNIDPNGKKGNPGPYKPDGGMSCSSPTSH